MAETKRRRSIGKIDQLPDHLRDTVEQMLLGGSSYKNIVFFLKEQGQEVSQMSVCRYASKYLATVEQLKLTQENFRMIKEEVDRYPDLDTTEVILRLASQQVLNALNKAPEEAWEDVEPDKLLKNTTALIRAASYKRRTDLQNRTETEVAIEANKTLLADLIGKKHPELYNQLLQVLETELALLQDSKEGSE
ncbi:MAG: phage protein Gp27 family protein [Oscillospiraceae bacterium]